jgi:hypothetical protein
MEIKMFRKIKSLFIILLVMSLSFVPYVNAASDIFNEPVHLDYENFKERMIEYAETPDFLKASTPSVIGHNEYIDIEDIFLAVDDLLTLPIDDDNDNTVETVKKTPLFKNMNSIIVDKIKETKEIFTFSDDEIPTWTDPYVKNGALRPQIKLYRDYNYIARSIQNAIHDNYVMEASGYNNIFRNNGGTIIDVDGISFTCDELFTRIVSSTILPNGYYRLNNVAPLASGQAPPDTISVERLISIMKDNVVVAAAGVHAFDARNALLNLMLKPMVKPPAPMTGLKSSIDVRYPAFLMDKNNPNTMAITNNFPNTPNRGIATYLNKNEKDTLIDINPERINTNSEALGLHVNANNQVEGERLIPEKEPGTYINAAETGVMFVVAIVIFIIAWIYK